MKRNALIQCLVDGGATITLAQDFGPRGPHGVAAAAYFQKVFYFVELWPEHQGHLHTLRGVTMKHHRQRVDIYQAHRLAATLAPMELDERALFHWNAWLASGERQRGFAEGLIAECLPLKKGPPERDQFPTEPPGPQPSPSP